MNGATLLATPPRDVAAINQKKAADALFLLESLINDAIRRRQNGALAIRIPVRGGKLGTVRRIVEDDHE